MQTVAILIILVAMAVSLVAIAGCCVPMPGLYLPTRKRAALVLVGAVVVMIAGLLMVDPPTPAAPLPEAAVAAKPAFSVPSLDSKGLLAAQATDLLMKIAETGKPCEIASESSASIAKTGDRYAMFPVVKDAVAVCNDAAEATRKLIPPLIANSEVAAAFDTAIEKCAFGHEFKAKAMSQYLKVIDGDARPSTVTAAKESMDTATEAGSFCFQGFFAATKVSGITTD